MRRVESLLAGAAALVCAPAVGRASPTLTTLATFAGGNGANPQAGLTPGPTGDLYGTTTYDGANNLGTVFKVAAGTGPLTTVVTTTVVTFAGPNGSRPAGRVVIDAAGDLYGTTPYGWANGDGTVYRIDAKTGRLTTLVAVDGATSGLYPYAGLVADAAGNLYGTTSHGGPTDDGTVFELAGGGFVVPEPAGQLVTAVAAAALGFAPLACRRRCKPQQSAPSYRT